MTGDEGLEQLVHAGLFPADALDDLRQVVERVHARVARGELTEAQGDAICSRHAERMVTARERTQGRLTADDRQTALYIVQALDAKAQA